MFCAVIFNWFRAVGLPAALPDVFSQRVLLYLLQQQQSNIAATCIWNDNWDRYGDVKEEPWQSIKSRMARVKILDSMMWWRERERERGLSMCSRTHSVTYDFAESTSFVECVLYLLLFLCDGRKKAWAMHTFMVVTFVHV